MSLAVSESVFVTSLSLSLSAYMPLPLVLSLSFCVLRSVLFCLFLVYSLRLFSVNTVLVLVYRVDKTHKLPKGPQELQLPSTIVSVDKNLIFLNHKCLLYVTLNPKTRSCQSPMRMRNRFFYYTILIPGPTKAYRCKQTSQGLDHGLRNKRNIEVAVFGSNNLV